MAWKPDDSFLDISNGEIKGVKRIKDALARHGKRLGKIYTSKDQDMDTVRKELEHTNAAPGFQQFQLPVALGPNQDVLAFMTIALIPGWIEGLICRGGTGSSFTIL